MIFIEPVRAQRHLISLQIAEETWRVFEIKFGAAGDVHVFLRFFSPQHALIGRYVCEGDGQSSTKAALVDRHHFSKVPIHFSHHLSGEVHLQADERRHKLKSEATVRQSVPLLETTGHFFTLQVIGLSNLQANTGPLPQKRYRAAREHYFGFSSVETPSFRLVGRMYTPRSLREIAGNEIASQMINGWATVHSDEGQVRALFIAPPITERLQYRGHCLCLTCHQYQPDLSQLRVSGKEVKQLMFLLGGFDDSERMRDLSKPVEMLFAQISPLFTGEFALNPEI